MTAQAFLADDGPVLLEINPRFGGSVPLAFATGGYYPGWILQMPEGKLVDSSVGEYTGGFGWYGTTPRYLRSGHCGINSGRHLRPIRTARSARSIASARQRRASVAATRWPFANCLWRTWFLRASSSKRLYPLMTLMNRSHQRLCSPCLPASVLLSQGQYRRVLAAYSFAGRPRLIDEASPPSRTDPAIAPRDVSETWHINSLLMTSSSRRNSASGRSTVSVVVDPTSEAPRTRWNASDT